MTITPEIAQLRKQYVGASDAPAVCGCDPWRNAADIWREKVYDLIPIKESPRIEAGNRLEPVLLRYAADILKQQIDPGGTFIDEDAHMIANTDGRVKGVERAIVECKTTGISDGWGKTDEVNAVPAGVLVQTHAAMELAEAEICWVPMLLASRGWSFNLYRVERNPELAKIVVDRCREFAEQYMIPRIAPPEDLPSMEVLKRIQREPDTWATVPASLVDTYEAAKEAAKQADTAKKEAQRALLAAAGDATGIRSASGAYIYKEINVRERHQEAYSYRKLIAYKETA